MLRATELIMLLLKGRLNHTGMNMIHTTILIILIILINHIFLPSILDMELESVVLKLN